MSDTELLDAETFAKNVRLETSLIIEDGGGCSCTGDEAIDLADYPDILKNIGQLVAAGFLVQVGIPGGDDVTVTPENLAILEPFTSIEVYSPE